MRLTFLALTVGTLALAACTGDPAGPATAEAPSASADTVQSSPAAPTTSGVAPSQPMPGMTAEEHEAMEAGSAATAAHGQGHAAAPPADMAGMDHGDMPGMGPDTAAAVQAGWYRSGRFQPCGSTQTYALDATADIDSKIREGKMSAGDPVYVRLAGTARGDTFTVRRVERVGSPTPVRDCPMTGTTTQR